MTKEIWTLAQHHKDILERRFLNNYRYALHESSTFTLGTSFTDCHFLDWLRLEVWEAYNLILLVASFSSSFVKIEFSPFKEMAGTSFVVRNGNPRHAAFANFTKEISYADPKFTDDMLSDILEDWVAK